MVALGHPYVIVSSPRAASSTFCMRLESVSAGRVVCQHEMLSPDPVKLRALSRKLNLSLECGQKPRACMLRSLHTILREFWERCEWNVSCGFKLFASHLVPEGHVYARSAESIRGMVHNFVDAARKQGVQRFVLLERRNKSAQYASLTRAFASGDWSSAGGLVGPTRGWSSANFSQRISLRMFEEACHAWYIAFRRLEHVSVMNVYAEDVINDELQMRHDTVQRTIAFILSPPVSAQMPPAVSTSQPRMQAQLPWDLVASAVLICYAATVVFIKRGRVWTLCCRCATQSAHVFGLNSPGRMQEISDKVPLTSAGSCGRLYKGSPTAERCGSGASRTLIVSV